MVVEVEEEAEDLRLEEGLVEEEGVETDWIRLVEDDCGMVFVVVEDDLARKAAAAVARERAVLLSEEDEDAEAFDEAAEVGLVGGTRACVCTEDKVDRWEVVDDREGVGRGGCEAETATEGPTFLDDAAGSTEPTSNGDG